MAPALALVHGFVIDGTGRAQVRNGTVLVREGRIDAVGPSVSVPRDAEVVDIAGHTVVPGLFDVHVHITLSSFPDLTAAVYTRPLAVLAFETVRNLAQTLHRGVTTIRTVGDFGHLDIVARDAIRSGWIQGPRIFAAGRSLTATGGHGRILRPWAVADVGDQSEVVDGVEQVRAAVRRQMEAGADHIKIYQTGGVIDPGGRIETEEYSDEELDMIVRTATMGFRRVCSHAHNKSGILRSIRAGVRSIEHGMYLDEECAKAAVEHDVFYVPTLAVMQNILDHGPAAGLPAYVMQNVADRTRQHREAVKLAYDAGVKIATGTDAGSVLTPHGSAGREAELLAACGIPVVEAIRCATQRGAELIGRESEVGTIVAGRIADLVVLNGNPVDDPSVLGRPEAVARVYQGGRPINAPQAGWVPR